MMAVALPGDTAVTSVAAIPRPTLRSSKSSHSGPFVVPNLRLFASSNGPAEVRDLALTRSFEPCTSSTGSSFCFVLFFFFAQSPDRQRFVRLESIDSCSLA